MSIVSKTRGIVGRDFRRIRRFRESPVESASLCCSYAACAVAAVGFIAAVVLFAVNGGYGEQIEAIKTNGAELIEKNFSGGTVSILYGPFVSGPVLGLMALSVALTLVDFYKTSSVVRKVFVSLTLALTAAAAVLLVLVDRALSGKIGADTPVVSMLKWAVDTFGIGSEAGLILPPLVSLVVLAILLYLQIRRKQLLDRVIAAGLLAFAFLPLLTLIVENLLALAAMVLVLALVMAVVLLVGKSVASGLSESGSGAAKKRPEAKKEKPAEVKAPQKEEPRTIEFEANIKIYVDEGLGFGAPMTKCIFADMPLRDHKFICTLRDFQDGKVIIKRGGQVLNRIL